ELRKPPNLTSGGTTFDIKTLTSDFLVRPEFDIPTNGTGELYVHVSVEFGYTYIDGIGDQITERNVIPSQDLSVFNGYNYYMDGINFVPNAHLGTTPPSDYQNRVLTDGGTVESRTCIPSALLGENNDGFWMTDKPTTMCVPKWTNMGMYAWNDSQTGFVTNVCLKVNGQLQFCADLKSNQSKIYYVACGTAQIRNNGWIPDGEELEYYEIYGADDSLNPVTRIYTFYAECNQYPCKYGFQNLQFMNRYGVWDNLICYGARHDMIDIDRQEILHSPLEI
ncbi:unnamed protein product, partial [marine sediment metagenome]